MKGLPLYAFVLLAISVRACQATRATRYYETRKPGNSGCIKKCTQLCEGHMSECGGKCLTACVKNRINAFNDGRQPTPQPRQQQPRQLGERSVVGGYYDPFGGDVDISGVFRQLGHRVQDDDETVGAAMLAAPATSFAPERQQKPTPSTTEKTGPSQKPKSKIHIVVGGLTLVGLVASVAVAHKRRNTSLSSVAVEGIEHSFISLEEDEFEKVLESFRVDEEETGGGVDVSIEDFRPPCLDPSNYDPEWSCSITYNQTAYFKVIGNYMIDDGDIVGVTIYQSGRLSALSDFSNAKLLTEDDPTFNNILEIIEEQIRGKILCLQFKEGSRDIAVSDADTIGEDDTAVIAPGTWYDISMP
jgi:hypothetical protein